MSQFVLASASPRRQEILRRLGYRFRVYPAAVPEIGADFFYGRVPSANAVAKSAAVAALFPEELVLGADTVIECDGQIIGKPVDIDDAIRILSLLSGRTHEVVTGIALCGLAGRFRCVFCERTAVTFLPLDAKTINSYLARVHVLDKAGAYAIQEFGEMIVGKISGPLDNVIGLPGDKVSEALRCCGINP